jgi:ketosteroid isomerase-like protein
VRPVFIGGLICGALAWCFAGLALAADAPSARQDMFLALVRERHLPPVDSRRWATHVAADAVWVGNGLRVATLPEVQGMQVDIGMRVEIEDFAVHDYGDTAVLTYLVVQHLPQAGGETTLRLRKMDTYLSRDGRWQLVANAEVVGKPDRKPISLDVAALDRVTGVYETMLAGKPVRTRIWREGTRLFAQTEGQEKGELLPLSPTLFFEAADPQEGGAENVFALGADGRAISWTWRSAGVEFPARRVADVAPRAGGSR